MGISVADDDRQLFLFAAHCEDELLDIMADRADTELHPVLPVLNLATTKPPGNRYRWSLPPGHLRASYDKRRDIDLDGHHYLEVLLDPVYRFSRKHQHRIAPVVERWLKAQTGRPIP